MSCLERIDQIESSPTSFPKPSTLPPAPPSTKPINGRCEVPQCSDSHSSAQLLPLRIDTSQKPHRQSVNISTPSLSIPMPLPSASRRKSRKGTLRLSFAKSRSTIRGVSNEEHKQSVDHMEATSALTLPSTKQLTMPSTVPMQSSKPLAVRSNESTLLLATEKTDTASIIATFDCDAIVEEHLETVVTEDTKDAQLVEGNNASGIDTISEKTTGKKRSLSQMEMSSFKDSSVTNSNSSTKESSIGSQSQTRSAVQIAVGDIASDKAVVNAKIKARKRIKLVVPKCKVGDLMETLWAEDCNWHTCEIVRVKATTRKPIAPLGAPLLGGGFEYYIHVVGFDRRSDRWVAGGRLREMRKVKEAVASDSLADGSVDATTNAVPATAQRELANATETESATATAMIGLSSDESMLRVRSSHSANGSHGDSDGDSDKELKEDTGTRASATRRKSDSANETALIEEIYSDQTKVRNIERIQLGRHLIDAWYFSPFPESYGRQSQDLLYICEYCLKYMKSGVRYAIHRRECFLRHPPGTEIYRGEKDAVSVFEVDGSEQKVYCQNLCLLAKLFFDHKTLYFDVTPFLFYVVCERDARGFHICGYFSKEKKSPENFNLACILTLPPHQKKGVGRLIVALSYELTLREHRNGSPEKPLSDLGAICYESYWRQAVLSALEQLATADEESSVEVDSVCKLTAMDAEDTRHALKQLRMLQNYRGCKVALCKRDKVRQLLAYYRKKDKERVFHFEPKLLKWSPPVSKKRKKH